VNKDLIILLDFELLAGYFYDCVHCF
jgi:hypothetical protein